MTEIVTSQATLMSARDFAKGTLRERREDILAEFLRLQISPQTQRLYAAAIGHFFRSMTGESASPELIHQFLQLEQGQRDYAIARLLWDNALRRVEIERLTIGDFDKPKLWIRGKGRSEKELIDLSAKSIDAIEDWLTVRGSSIISDPLFIALDNRSYGKPISGRSIDRNVVKCLGVESKVLSPHKVRHSTITAALEQTNGDVRKVQKFSRHRKLDTLMIYDDNRLGVQGEITDSVADLV
jgi:site-specific recombinase XerC